MNLGDMIAATARRHPTNLASALGERRLTYAALDKASNRMAHALRKTGLKPGDRVALLLSNTPDFPIIYFGIVKTGAVAVPLDTRYAVDEIASIFASCQPRMLIADTACLEPLVPALPQFRSIEYVVEMGTKFADRFLTYPEIMTGAPEEPVGVEVKPGATAHIAYTSASTNHPAGAVMSHRALMAHAAGAVEAYRQTADDTVIMFALPLYHAFALAIATICSYYAGSNVIMVPGLSIDAAFEAVERHRATVFMGVPYTMALAVTLAEKEGVKHDISSLRVILCGGSAVTASLTTRFKQLYRKDLQQIWGLTEGVAHVTAQVAERPYKPGSCGPPMPGFRIRIVDNRGNELPQNVSGEVLMQGPLMDAYFNNPGATAQVMQDGWLDTGDLGKLDEDGELYILARKKEIIIVKGQNVCPADIEEVLLSHPKVALAAVVGVHDDLRGERIRAVVTLKPGATATERELKEHCREHMAIFKMPKEIIIGPGLPKRAAVR